MSLLAAGVIPRAAGAEEARLAAVCRRYPGTGAGLAVEGLAEAGLAEAGLAEAGLAEAGLAEAGLAKAGSVITDVVVVGLAEANAGSEAGLAKRLADVVIVGLVEANAGLVGAEAGLAKRLAEAGSVITEAKCLFLFIVVVVCLAEAKGLAETEPGLVGAGLDGAGLVGAGLISNSDAATELIEVASVVGTVITDIGGFFGAPSLPPPPSRSIRYWTFPWRSLNCCFWVFSSLLV